MKILFIRDDFDDEPLGLMYVSALFKKYDVQTDLVLTKHTNYIDYFKIYNPDIVAYSVTTGYHKYYLDINNVLKKIKPEIFSLFGGPHPTFFKDFINEKNVDAIAIGEIENSVEYFVNNFNNKENLYKTPNFYFNVNGKIIKNELNNLIKNIDEIPFPDRELVYKYKFAENNKKKSFITGRGCPYKCSYCFNHIFHELYKNKGQIIRKRSVDNVINEIKQVKKNYPLRFIHFVDDIFIINKNWLKEFAEKYPKEIGLLYTCNLRANLVTEEIAYLLKKSGCFSISIAVESGNEIVRNKYLNRGLSNQQIIQACQHLKKQGLKIATQNIVGIPGGNLNADFDTVKINHKCKPDYAWCTIYQPYPGTKLAETAQKLGLFNGDLSNIAYSFHEDSILNIDNKLEVINLHKLFGLASEFPRLFFVFKFLIKLKLTKLYSLLRKMWNGYTYKYRIMPGVTFKDIFFRSLKKIKK